MGSATAGHGTPVWNAAAGAKAGKLPQHPCLARAAQSVWEHGAAPTVLVLTSF